MARPKKAVEEKPKEGATLSIDVDSFVRTRDSVSIIPLLHSSSSSSRPGLGARGIFNVVVASRHHTVIIDPPHLTNLPSDTFIHLAICILTPPRLYPERIHRCDRQSTSLRTRSHCLHLDLRVPMELWEPRANVRPWSSTAIISRSRH